MRPECFHARTRVEAPAADVFRWHARPGALERLTPPWERIEEKRVEGPSGIQVGARVIVTVRLGPLRYPWISEHRVYDEGQYFFRDVQVKGPFARWEHTHLFEPDGPSACYLNDHIEYALPFGILGRLIGGAWVRRKLERIFAYRHRVTSQDLATRCLDKGASTMQVLVSGSSGFIGSALVPFLSTNGHRVTCLVRRPPSANSLAIQWDPLRGEIDVDRLEGLDGVVHLAGENLTTGRWTADKKAKIRESRVNGTRLLCRALANLSRPPRVLVCASAIGYYGDRGEERVDEDSPPGSGFLAEVCREWEAAAQPAVQRGIRVVHARLGVVLSPSGGALALLLPVFKLGGGGRLGDGRHHLSWIALDDVLGAIDYALRHEEVRGPMNVAAPNPVTNRAFTTTLGSVLRRPTWVPVPAFAIRAIFGELADEALLASTRVSPRKLLTAGYQFRYPQLEGALRHLLGRLSGKTPHSS